ncbi:MAG: SH3 domain-containing protein [Selenomonadaceae bacterium]|nr:SH3 domain-containing protein [Selenomonadaceae bacterium]
MQFIIIFLAVFFLPSICSAATIEITDSRATPEYWISRNVNGDKVLLTPEKIALFNAQILAKDNFSADLANLNEKVSAIEVNNAIKEVEGDDYNKTHRAVIDMPMRYAVTTRRGNIRVLPQPWNGDKYDDFQGSAIDPAEAVAVFCESPDGQFVFVRSRYYMGWLNKSDLAFTDRKTWLSYVNPQDFLVVTANKKIIEIGKQALLFQMGAIIPIVNPNDQDDIWIARLPVSVNGQLAEVKVNIAMNDKDVNKGFLACTENNFIRQAFKFLGDEYGWGGLNDSVDCSAFMQDVYHSMGIKIPRDTGNQRSFMPIWAVFNNVNNAERWDIVSRAPIGSLFHKPGHVMMKLGNDAEGRPLIIHAASSYIDNDNGKVYIRKVIVSDLHYRGGSIETIDALTDIVFYGD